MLPISPVFISYAGESKDLVQELSNALEGAGITTWVDFKDLRPGQRLNDELEHAIADAAWIVILVGPDLRASRWQEAEWRAALVHDWSSPEKRLLPVVVGETETPPFLRTWVSLKVDPVAEPATWTRHVIEALGSARGEAEYKLSDASWLERRHRLDEIASAAEEMRRGQSGHLQL